MKRNLLTLAFIFALAGALSAQAGAFPGINAQMRKELATVKRAVGFPLPTWLPAGFRMTHVHKNLGRRVKIEDRQLVIVYTRHLRNGRLQRFAIDAGFDGLGDLMYDGRRLVRTGVGPVSLLYQPKDDEGKRMPDFAMTEWFDVGNTAFRYDGMYGTEELGGSGLTMISLSDTERILKSLRRY
jgi:hypothetical protein